MAPDYKDSGHRPHARFKGEIPENDIFRGPFNLNVTLDTWGPKDNLMATLYNELQANWGSEPSRVEHDEDLTHGQLQYVKSCFQKKTLQQVLELITFAFTVDGVTRAATHQLVRTRIGAAMMQHGGRDNDWRHRPWTMPETIYRAGIQWERSDGNMSKNTNHHCIDNPEALETFMSQCEDGSSLFSVIKEQLKLNRELYAALVDAGIPWQDARRLLPIGLQTYIHINYNFLGLRGVLENRLEHVMDWEINCIAQLMKRQLHIHCPGIIADSIGSHSDLANRAVFGGMESWPPDGKYPVDESHRDIPREHRSEQMPFWVLHPDSMRGGSVRWIPTNGTYPHEGMKWAT